VPSHFAVVRDAIHPTGRLENVPGHRRRHFNEQLS
jgi:hypothetical protein